MDVEKALAWLTSSVLKERLKAARFFSSNPTLISTDALREALHKESIPWITKALTLALERAEISVVRPIDAPESPGGEVTNRVLRSIMAAATEEVTGTILHEFGTIIGELNLKASAEFENFKDSQTQKLLLRLKELLKAVRKLKEASGSPTYSEFDLSELVSQILDENSEITEGITITDGSQRPFTVSADRGSMYLAIINGLRNASESVRAYSRKSPPEILFAWGRAGDENYFAMIDSGSGFRGNPQDALRIGVTSKPNHTGYGLATAASAIKAMEGDLQLSNSLDGGARFELRWYRDNEDFTG
ncbi:hypothetical protein ACTACH_22050 [Pseudomonas syringae]|uniref:ATP-binding protein n=1 Tax=Pseudomonas TaxID=286 RepID=UPI0005C9DD16|nr:MULTISPECIES: ATP-binding protein [Pseudomonas]PBQ05063.1 ATP-binding protein [Pseudomonas congelans]